MTTLENSYCVPKDESEWSMLPDRLLWCRNDYAVFGMIDFEYQKREGKTEVPVSHFLDLLHDKIAGWRLEELGWKFVDGKVPYYEFRPNDNVTLSWAEKTQDAGVGFELADDATWFNLTTFTDLLTLIRMLTPNN